MMETILTIIRWTITLPTLAVETILKAITFVVLTLCIIFMAIFRPFFSEERWWSFRSTGFYQYGVKWQGNYLITCKVFDLWQ